MIVNVTTPYTDAGSRHRLMEEHTPVVQAIALRMMARLPSDVRFEELVSSGLLGLANAIESFDPNADLSFGQYAKNRVRGAILDCVSVRSAAVSGDTGASLAAA